MNQVLGEYVKGWSAQKGFLYFLLSCINISISRNRQRWKRAALCNRLQRVTKVTSTSAKNSVTINLTTKGCCDAPMLILDAAQHHPSTLVWGMLLDWLREYTTVWLKGNFLMFNMPQKPTVTQKTLSKASFSGGSPKIQCFFTPDWGEKKTRMRNNKRG